MSEIRWNTESVDAYRVDDLFVSGAKAPGAFKLFTEAGSEIVVGMKIRLPGDLLATIYFTPNIVHPRPVWSWDGSREKPTVSPSIRTIGGPQDARIGWHGFLRAGRLESC